MSTLPSTASSQLCQEDLRPCAVNTAPMALADAQPLLTQLPGWAMTLDDKAIVRRFVFKNFKQALAFVNQVGEVAEAARHHPDIRLGWGYAECLMQTHSIGGLHRNDFIIASRINVLFDSMK